MRIFEPRPDRDVFPLELAVRADDIDENGHVNNVVYVRWLQEAGAAHWSARVAAAERAPWSWVVLRHEIDYRLPLRLGDAVRARTWVGDPRGPRFDRFVLIERGDGQVCAQGRSEWALVDARSMRPARITKEMIAPFVRLQPD